MWGEAVLLKRNFPVRVGAWTKLLLKCHSIYIPRFQIMRKALLILVSTSQSMIGIFEVVESNSNSNSEKEDKEREKVKCEVGVGWKNEGEEVNVIDIWAWLKSSLRIRSSNLVQGHLQLWPVIANLRSK